MMIKDIKRECKMKISKCSRCGAEGHIRHLYFYWAASCKGIRFGESLLRCDSLGIRGETKEDAIKKWNDCQW